MYLENSVDSITLAEVKSKLQNDTSWPDTAKIYDGTAFLWTLINIIFPNIIIFIKTTKTSIRTMTLADCGNDIAQYCKKIATSYEALSGANVDYDNGISSLL